MNEVLQGASPYNDEEEKRIRKRKKRRQFALGALEVYFLSLIYLTSYSKERS
jgi:hypothetical protein